jgi:hypothetical protein
MEACELYRGTATSGTVAHGLQGNPRLASMNLRVRSNGFGDRPTGSRRAFDVSDALHHIEIMCYCAVNFALVIMQSFHAFL